MILQLATKYKKHSAFLLCYSFFLSNICSAASAINNIVVNNSSSSQLNYTLNYSNLKNARLEDYTSLINLSHPTGEMGNKIFTETIALGKNEDDDIGGPSQPEMSGFKPVGADNMVDLFTGDFSYNIPLLDVGGYPVNIFYNSGTTMDQEATWVGLGWNINPGTISRNMRGIPDDFDGSDKITKEQYTKDDITFGVDLKAGLEVFGSNMLKVNANFGVFSNNMRGMGCQLGVSPTLNISKEAGDDKTTSLSFTYGLSGNSQTGGSQNFKIGLGLKQKDGLFSSSLGAGIGYNSRMGLQDLHLTAEASKCITDKKSAADVRSVSDGFNASQTLGTSISFAYPSVSPSIKMPTRRTNLSLDLQTGLDLWGVFGDIGIGGYYTKVEMTENKVLRPAYGMLHMQKGNDDKQAMLDFNRLNDGVYTPNTPTIAIPVYTYDIFSISGEGTGGSFRAYRGDLGFVRDHFTSTDGESDHLGIDLGGGSYFKGGINGSLVRTPQTSGGWYTNNLSVKALEFQDKQEIGTQSVYFKNPGEKTIPDKDFQNTVGGEDLVRLKFAGTGSGSPIVLPNLISYDDNRNKKSIEYSLLKGANPISKSRDKRTQVISYLTAQEASTAGLNRQIPNYTGIENNDIIFGCNTNGVQFLDRTKEEYQKPHHISEISVLGQDGRRYIYGVPVYNKKQVEYTFNIDKIKRKASRETQLCDYAEGLDNSTGKNDFGRDNFVEVQHTPGYTHSFLLSGLLSPNYVDVTGDGITEDDLGDAVKFNYSKVDPVQWRTPIGKGKASYSEGIKTEPKDDKAHIIYGEREQWYLYTVESKNMIARFYTSGGRQDSRNVNRNGVVGSSSARQLDKISLFSKADLISKGAKATPIKTVHFVYDYTLCSGVANSTSGKLTLNEIYFTYNGNERSIKNKYKFAYKNNVSFNATQLDRWGGYKPAKLNPTSELLNQDYPYTVQPYDFAMDLNNIKIKREDLDNRASAWALDNIKLPSGGSIKVDYEADDYAYVQDRRASCMYQILGFGNSAKPNDADIKNKFLYNNKKEDYEWLYVRVPKNGDHTKDAIKNMYLGNYDKPNSRRQVAMKIAVNVPPTPGDAGFELVPVYAEIDDWAFVTGDNSDYDVISLHTKKLASNYSPMVQFCLQFLKNNLPGKAYPGSDLTDENSDVEAAIKALAAAVDAMKEAFQDGMDRMKGASRRYCRETLPGASFIRLTEPNCAKIGGGLRVKKITINDNWDIMTGKNDPTKKMEGSTYGQEYFYKTKELIGGVEKEISSGVASWEPGIGSDENPHREAIMFYNKNAMGPYDYSVVDLPLAEMFFPSPGIGYSRVEVKSIHRIKTLEKDGEVVKLKNPPSFQVTEYFTTKDFPTKVSYTPLSEYNAKDEFKTGALSQAMHMDVRRAIALSQGFKVDLNDMNGKMKKQSTYADNNPDNPVSYTENFYNIYQYGDNKYKFNHDYNVINDPNGKVESGALGREVEVMTDFREHITTTNSLNLNFNLDIINGCLIPIPVPTLFSPLSRESNEFRSAAMLKVVNHYSMMSKVVAVDKGSMISTENMVYDGATGDVILTKTQNEHNAPIYNFTYSGHWAYEAMGQAYQNIDYVFPLPKTNVIKDGKFIGLNANIQKQINDALHEGDEIYVYSPDTNGPDYEPNCDEPNISSTPVTLYTPDKDDDTHTDGVPVQYYLPLVKNKEGRLWALDANKQQAGKTGSDWFFIDRYGKGFTAKNVYMRIIRSARKNMLGNSVGSITSLKEPIDPVNKKLDFNKKNKILQASAATFKEHWRTDDKYGLLDVIDRKTATITNDSDIICAADTNSKYSACGSYIYDNYNSSLTTFNRTLLNFNNEFWGKWYNKNNFCKYSPITNSTSATTKEFNAEESSYDINLSDGISKDNSVKARVLIPTKKTPLNRTGIWACSPTGGVTNLPVKTWIGFSRDIYFPTTKDYYLGFGTDNSCKILIDGNTIIDLSSKLQDMENFTLWHIVKFSTTEGMHKITFMGYNYGGPASIGLEIYNNTASEITVANHLKNPYVNPDPNSVDILFSTENMIGQKISNGKTSVTSCPSGYTLDNSTKPPSCYLKSTVCQSIYTPDFTINPYIQGIWGNWRVDYTHVFYGNRAEQTPTKPDVDLRTAGTFENFDTYWKFGNELTKNPSAIANKLWVWNSKITQYNKKGYDIENTDPLGRYNAGLYGYNQQLPVAVTNNSRYREQMFDGFEDKDYKSANCSTEVCKTPSHINYNETAIFSIDEKHSGLRSLKVEPSNPAIINVPIKEIGSEDVYGVTMKPTTTTSYDVVNNQNVGVGFSVQSLGHDYPSGTNFDWKFINGNPMPQNMSSSAWYFGYLQPVITGKHYFRTNVDDGVRIAIKDQSGNFINPTGNDPNIIKRLSDAWNLTNSNNIGVDLERGKRYYFEIEYYNGREKGHLGLEWKHPGIKDFEILPKERIFQPQQLSGLQSVAVNCTKLNNINVTGNALTDNFSPIAGKKMVFSAWVKEKDADCKQENYLDNNITISFKLKNGNTVNTIAHKVDDIKDAITHLPDNHIIEGWQRYEFEFDVPDKVTGDDGKTPVEMNVFFNSLNGKTNYFDDIRIHPFHANMKSFVYDPYNLRLIAEMDENNYATFYEYDEDGTIIRLKKETSKGIKTIKETRSALQTSVD